MNHSNNLQEVAVPKRLFSVLMDAYQKWEKVSEELEDFLLVSDVKFVNKMRVARSEHLSGKIKNLSVLKTKLATK
ncbi:hypothetical protein COT20_01930 [bacterium (Candidatus Gribaldobacteria) CG08_land_8_20_14_0_20_39_15]|uniref:Uncharacterized protein n=1 Tax=bacterium (Candidatus Gribaldobacteria) CG08_land_8_20_14_0_20_39_15 TaxID=2014273 RepID=A0A2M6XUA1_9BACT|nr:MAG: hypothetical protein COT20_01930 [bacterium (Candidatus Gribaldobacteria) CG08_land_8_20_14_0_20_39_15]